MIYYLYNSTHLPNPDSWMWFQSLVWSTWFPSPYSSCQCDSWERRAQHYIRLLSKPTLMKAGWLQHRWQMQGGQPVMLIFVYAIQQVIIKVTERSVIGWGGDRRGVHSFGDSDSWLKGSGDFQWFTCCSYIDRQARSSLPTAVVILGPKRLRPSDSCPAKGEVLPPVWPQQESRFPERAISGPSWPHGASPDDWMTFCSHIISIHRKTCHGTLIHR